ncbi:hypothetical protein LEP1GSC038_0947 [Leptospira weilii str. 2006001855]|uniref:Uncharacterized protein n=1 Tax=Leptospira weilii str. 2006001855 TaxID=996804 RepID=M6G7Q4_9LEPT|nr:hypothetical protein LEP1GSC038_0947 [Leptospira weilii str. 2006001855]
MHGKNKSSRSINGFKTFLLEIMSICSHILKKLKIKMTFPKPNWNIYYLTIKKIRIFKNNMKQLGALFPL